MPDMRTVILIAHERMEKALVKLVQRERAAFDGYRLLATTETAAALEKAFEDIEVTSVFSGRKGGEIQLCGLICSNTIAAVFFLRDPRTPGFDEPDITPYYRACDLNNVPLATNIVGGLALAQWLGRKSDQEENAA